jgi:medium-chain acyl-[acyl-carrier-protein] hydrolase
MPEAYPWILRPRARPRARFRLFCFARAGGGASSFRGWAEDCHEEIEVALIQPPGRENRLREAPLQSMRTLVSSITTAMADFLDRPYALYGHSLGAKVAFETIRELRRRGLPQPVHLFAAASSSPGVRWAHPLLHPLSDLDLLGEIQRRYGGVPAEVLADQELCALLMPALRADITIIETYRYTEEPPLLNPITCLCGSTDSMTPELDAWDWRNQTSSEFRYETFPGDHFFPAQTRTLILDLIAGELKLSSPQGLGGHAAPLRIRGNG